MIKFSQINYDSIIFDCDGVILDSNRLKSDAFGETVKDYPKEIAEQFVEYHKANGGISRYVKFEYFLKNMVNDYSEAKLNSLLEKYKEITVEGLMKCDECNGVLEFLNKYKSKAKLFVVSGGSEEDLLYVFNKRNLMQFFLGMGGSPMTKDVIIRDFIRNNLLYGKTVYFGDSRLDYEVALKFGFDFVFLYGYTEFKYWKDYCQSNKIIAFKDFNDLLNAEANK